jgi:hypothetical protein
MPTRKAKYTGYIFMTFILMLAACAPAAPATDVSNDFEVTNIVEGDFVTSEITQTKSFNQCNSGSPFKAEVQFSESSGQVVQRELVLSAGMGGELGLSAVAKVQLQGAVEQHYSSTSSSNQGHQEGVNIEVPAHTQQEYTIVWRESRREGTVEFLENGEAKTVNYSY